MTATGESPREARVGDRGYVNVQGGIVITVTEIAILGADGIVWAKCADAQGEWRWIETWRVVVLSAASGEEGER